MKFSPVFLSAAIVQPLRYLFERGASSDLKWSEGDHSKIEIDTINNYNKKVLQAKPRILVSRGAYKVTPTGLTDNLGESRGPYQLKGLQKDTKMLFLDGYAQVLIEARNEGTCEKVCEFTQHFLTWITPMLCDTYDFKSFGLPLQVSPCTPSKEDTEIFQISIGIPWSKEELFKIEDDGVLLKGFKLTLG